MTRLVIVVEGGLVANVTADRPGVEILVLNADLASADFHYFDPDQGWNEFGPADEVDPGLGCIHEFEEAHGHKKAPYKTPEAGLDAQQNQGDLRREGDTTMISSTLVLAYDTEDKMAPQSIFLFVVHHDRGVDVVEAVAKAFNEWAGTPAGTRYIEDNGSNWGDALDIPALYQGHHGIVGIDNLIIPMWKNRRATGFELERCTFDAQIIVDHSHEFVSRRIQ